jgi:hypothetical protein
VKMHDLQSTFIDVLRCPDESKHQHAANRLTELGSLRYAERLSVYRESFWARVVHELSKTTLEKLGNILGQQTLEELVFRFIVHSGGESRDIELMLDNLPHYLRANGEGAYARLCAYLADVCLAERKLLIGSDPHISSSEKMQWNGRWCRWLKPATPFDAAELWRLSQRALSNPEELDGVFKESSGLLLVKSSAFTIVSVSVADDFFSLMDALETHASFEKALDLCSEVIPEKSLPQLSGLIAEFVKSGALTP